MTPPTVYLIGFDDLPTIPDFLQLGAVVVVSGDHATLDRWRLGDEAGPTAPAARPLPSGLVVDLEGRRILWDGVPLALSDLEFRVLGALVARPGRARSFRDLRAAGWGESPAMTSDVEALRALIQRLRRKLDAAATGIEIEPVRGFGYRATVTTEGPPPGLPGEPVPAREPNRSPTGTVA
jgi:DNA-binding winged helix-turn-helix (wHTH) protein